MLFIFTQYCGTCETGKKALRDVWRVCFLGVTLHKTYCVYTLAKHTSADKETRDSDILTQYFLLAITHFSDQTSNRLLNLRKKAMGPLKGSFILEANADGTLNPAVCVWESFSNRT